MTEDSAVPGVVVGVVPSGCRQSVGALSLKSIKIVMKLKVGLLFIITLHQQF